MSDLLKAAKEVLGSFCADDGRPLDATRMKNGSCTTESLKALRLAIEKEEMAAVLPRLRPEIVCLCGSTRFGDAFREANLRETLAGKIVLSIGCDFKSDQAIGLTDQDKARLDELHKRKIDLADEVLILNIGGYIGASTRSEIEYAKRHCKRIRYLEAEQENRKKEGG